LLNEGTGQTVADSSGSFDCTLGADSGSSTNDPAWVAEGLSFDGGDFVRCGAIYAINTTTTPFSLSVVFNSTNLNRFIIAYSSGAGVGWAATQNANDILFRIITTASTNELGIRTTNTISTSTWYHLTISVPANPTAATTKIYLNGVAVSQDTDTDTLSSSPDYAANTFNLGGAGTGGNGPFIGTQGLARFFSGVALDATQVAALCNADKVIMAARSVTITCP